MTWVSTSRGRCESLRKSGGKFSLASFLFSAKVHALVHRISVCEVSSAPTLVKELATAKDYQTDYSNVQSQTRNISPRKGRRDTIVFLFIIIMAIC